MYKYHVQEKFKDTKGVIRSRKSKDRQHNTMAKEKKQQRKISTPKLQIEEHL
jgi:hypothetical protein